MRSVCYIRKDQV